MVKSNIIIISLLFGLILAYLLNKKNLIINFNKWNNINIFKRKNFLFLKSILFPLNIFLIPLGIKI